MELKRFSEQLVNAVEEARSQAIRLGHAHHALGTEYILLGILQLKECQATKLLNNAGVFAENAQTEIRRLVGKRTRQSPSEHIHFTNRAKRAFETGWLLGELLGIKMALPETILLGILKDPTCIASQALNNLKVNTASLFIDLVNDIISNSANKHFDAARFGNSAEGLYPGHGIVKIILPFVRKVVNAIRDDDSTLKPGLSDFFGNFYQENEMNRAPVREELLGSLVPLEQLLAEAEFADDELSRYYWRIAIANQDEWLLNAWNCRQVVQDLTPIFDAYRVTVAKTGMERTELYERATSALREHQGLLATAIEWQRRIFVLKIEEITTQVALTAQTNGLSSQDTHSLQNAHEYLKELENLSKTLLELAKVVDKNY